MQQPLQFDGGARVLLLRFGLHALPGPDRLAWLTPDELARAERFHFERHKRRFLAARCGLRAALAEATGRAPAALRFVDGPFGKPRLEGEPDCQFNLSHSEDEALLAIGSDGELGADIEVLRRMSDALALARMNYTADECAALEALPPAERDAGFLRLWTRKEACLKAIGTGLSVHPSCFSAGLDRGETTVRIAWPQGAATLALRELDAGPGALAAVALRLDD